MADLGVHKTDVIHFLTGERIVKTSAVITTRDKKSEDGCLATVDDNAFAIYTMESGVVGTMHVSWTNYGTEENSTTLYMKKGVIRIYDDPKYSLIVEKSNGDVISYQLDLLATAMKQSSGEYTSSGVIDTFINSITTNTPPALSGESALHPMQVIFANKRSAELGTAVDVD